MGNTSSDEDKTDKVLNRFLWISAIIAGTVTIWFLVVVIQSIWTILNGQ